MGEALIGGLLRSGWAAVGELAVAEPRVERRQELNQKFPGLVTLATPGNTVGAVLAVKPGDVQAACRDLAETGATRVLSIAAGVRLAQLESWLGPQVAVVRAMPNTPSLVGRGAAAVASGSAAGPDDLLWAEQILSAVGVVERVTEVQLDAVTGLSGSGPAYVFLLVEAMIEAGVAAGLPREVSRSLVVATVGGSAELLAVSGDEPERLRAAVTSPGGTTAAGLRVLEARAVRSAILEAVLAASDRARELGGA